EPKMYSRNKAMSTGPHAPLVLVNGPKGRAANLNSGMCALGPGAPSASNTVLGRAVRLTMMNVGHTYVGVSDMDTIGSPLKYSLCCAENEAESPWEPYHVTRGFAPDASTITVHFVYGICELHDFRSTTPEHLVQVFATAANNVAQVGTGLWLIGRRADPRSKTEEKEHNTLFVCPEHAQIFAKAGWGRREIQAALYRAARLPFRTMILNKEPKAMEVAHPELAWLADHPDLPVPIVEDPTCFDIAVVGAAARRGAHGAADEPRRADHRGGAPQWRAAHARRGHGRRSDRPLALGDRAGGSRRPEQTADPDRGSDRGDDRDAGDRAAPRCRRRPDRPAHRHRPRAAVRRPRRALRRPPRPRRPRRVHPDR